MSVIACVLIITIAIIWFPGNITAQSLNTENNTMHVHFLMYENSTLGLQIQYPYDWQKVEDDSNLTFYSMPQNSSSNGHILYPYIHDSYKIT